VRLARRRLGRAGLVVALLAAASSHARRASADGARVALVRPPVTTPSTREALNRIQGELTAEGFDVVNVDAAQSEPGGPAGPDGALVATIELVVDAQQGAVELRVIDRLTNKTVIRRTSIEAPEGTAFAQVLAVRAVELLRASLVELLMRARPQPAASAPPPAKSAIERAARFAASSLDAPRTSSIGVDAGAAGVFGFGGIGPALLGVLRVRGALSPSWQLRASLAALGTQPRADAPTRGGASSGGARVDQQIALFEVVARLRPGAGLHPVATLGAGALHVSAEGEPAFGFVARQSSGWSACADAGVGLELRLGAHFDLSFEAHALVTEPRQVIRFLDQDGPAVGEPSLLGTVTVVGWP